jgi:3-oxoacyl-[acyl-carrier protein] reductase
VSYESVVQASLRQIPMGRYGDPGEYGDTAAFLASRNASYITGSVIRVDGGQIQAI